MMKKLLCLVLGLLMVVPMLASCAGDGDAVENVTNEASRYTTTLNMWVMTDDEGVDPAQAAAVNEAINKITKAKFKTKLNIKYVKESEYYAKVEAALAEQAYALDNGLISKNQPDSEETIYNEYGVPELKYPEIKDYQVDILFIGDAGNISGYEKYREFADKEWLVALDGFMDNTAMKLYTYIDELYFDAIQYNGLSYGIPNNTVIGEYTYLMVDKALMRDEYYYTPSDFPTSSFYDVNFQKFLGYIFDSNVKNGYAAGDTEYVYPLYSADGTVPDEFVHYWSFDFDSMSGSYILKPDEFSLFGSFYKNDYLRGEKLFNDQLLFNASYANSIKNKLTWERTEGYITTDANAKAAAKFVTGGWELKAEYEKQGYEVLIMGTPRATDKDVFGSMFAVGGFEGENSASDRAIEIITYLNTDPELRNLLQYGIEGVNYTLETETIDEVEYQYVSYTEENKYLMDVSKTGNAFITYPDKVENIMAWEYGKKQNFEALAAPTLGMFFDFESYVIDEKSVRIVDAVSDAIAAWMEENIYGEDDLATALDNLGKLCPQGFAGDKGAHLLSFTGNDLTYTYNGATETITAADLNAALTSLSRAVIDDSKNATQSPYALYLDWRIMSGVADNLPSDDDSID